MVRRTVRSVEHAAGGGRSCGDKPVDMSRGAGSHRGGNACTHATPRSSIAVARSAGRLHPTFALWPLAVRAALESFLVDEGNRRVLSLIERQQSIAVDFEPVAVSGREIDPFFNINTPGDLAEAETILRGLRT